jgi:isopentenyl phosphate kinase
MELTILKLGGSILTRKYQDGEFDSVITDRLAREIKQALTKSPQRLILIHGAGGEVHRLAHQFNLQTGAKNPEQIDGALITHYAVRELTQQLLPILIKHELPIVPLPTNSMFMVKNGQPEVSGATLIKQALDTGLIPLLSGDMVFNDQVNFSILSGDQIAAILAKEFDAKKIIFASDVDGLYNSDPKTDPQAKLIERAELSSIDTTPTAPSSIDITNQMLGKIAALMKDNNKIPVQILNGLVAGRLEQALTGEPIVGTVIQ